MVKQLKTLNRKDIVMIEGYICEVILNPNIASNRFYLKVLANPKTSPTLLKLVGNIK